MDRICGLRWDLYIEIYLLSIYEWVYYGFVVGFGDIKRKLSLVDDVFIGVV